MLYESLEKPVRIEARKGAKHFSQKKKFILAKVNGAKQSFWFSASRANDASGQVQHLSVAGHSTSRKFFIVYVEYHNFLNSKFYYIFEDYAIFVSALSDLVLPPNSFTEGRTTRSKMPKMMKKWNFEISFQMNF